MDAYGCWHLWNMTRSPRIWSSLPRASSDQSICGNRLRAAAQWTAEGNVKETKEQKGKARGMLGKGQSRGRL